MRRTARLLAILPALVVLASCDLPGGTAPRALVPDQVPNDSPEDAVLLPAGWRIAGSVDPSDRMDWYEIAPPSEPQEVLVTCTGRISLTFEFGGTPAGRAAAPSNPLCTGAPLVLGVLDPSTIANPRLRYAAGYQDGTGPIEPYTLRLEYRDPEPGTGR
jgi:hypothetical protein